MKTSSHYSLLLKAISSGKKSLAVLIDPDKFDPSSTVSFLKHIPQETTYLFIGGSSVSNGATETTVRCLKGHTSLPLILFPGDHSHITPMADALLFLSLLSGRNAEYLVGQQVKSVEKLKGTSLEIISTGYLLIDGGHPSAVARVSGTQPLSQNELETIVHTALAGQYMGAKLIYLEAGSGAKVPVSAFIINAVKKAVNIPVVVGGGIKTEKQLQTAYTAGADLVVMGTIFENINNQQQ